MEDVDSQPLLIVPLAVTLSAFIAGLFWAAAFARDIPAQPVPIRNLDYRRSGQARQMR